MSDLGTRRAAVPLLLLSAVVVAVAAGLARGVWVSNLHNGLLALAFTGVGVYVLRQRPDHPEGRLLLGTGVVEAILFWGRQVGHSPAAPHHVWWGWLGVWPVAVGLGLTTLSVLCFPDGRLPSTRWRPVAALVVVVSGACALVSALWPVEYASTGVLTGHPFDLPGGDVAATAWDAVAHPAYAGLQLLWVVALVLRRRGSDAVVRAQVAWVAVAAACSAVLLALGLLTTGTPVPGVLAACLVPVAAGWAVVHGEHLAGYRALSWLSRAHEGGRDLPTELARAARDSVGGEQAVLWRGPPAGLRAVGTWPGPAPADEVALDALARDERLQVRTVTREGEVVGALTVRRHAAHPPSATQQRLLDDLAAQADLVLDHLQLLQDAARRRATTDLDHLSPRERQVLELMARGLSNAAICRELHLSVKTVEPLVGSVFAKLGLPQDSSTNRRVLAVLAYHGDGTRRLGA